MSAEPILSAEQFGEVLMRGQKKALDTLGDGCAILAERMTEMLDEHFAQLLSMSAEAMSDTIKYEISRIMAKAQPGPWPPSRASGSGSGSLATEGSPPACKIPQDWAAILSTKTPIVRWNKKKRKFEKVPGAQVG